MIYRPYYIMVTVKFINPMGRDYTMIDEEGY